MCIECYTSNLQPWTGRQKLKLLVTEIVQVSSWLCKLLNQTLQPDGYCIGCLPMSNNHILISPHAYSHTCLNSHVHRQDEIRRNREVGRASMGSRWVWLEHRVAELNKHICRLDHLIQKRPGRENFVFAPPLSPACFCSIPNRALANGGVVAVASLNHRGKIVNGFNHHTSGTPSFTPLLLADSILGSRLQVQA